MKRTGTSLSDIAAAPGANAGAGGTEPFPQGGEGAPAGPAAAGNQDDPPEDPDAAAKAAAGAAKANAPDVKVAVVPAPPVGVAVDADGMPKHFAAEGVEKRHWIYKRNGQRFWKLVRPHEPKPVLMRNATQTWDGTEEEFKEQFERD